MTAFSLVGQDGNAFALMAYTKDAMCAAYRHAREKEDHAAAEKFGNSASRELMAKCMSGDYNNLLCLLSDMLQEVNSYLQLED